MASLVAPRGRAVLAAGVLVAFAVAVSVGVSSAAWAHASLVASDPEDGAVLDRAPGEVTLRFTEPVSPVDGAVGLVDQDGDEVAVEVESAADVVVVVLPPDLGEGGYALTWRVVSADSHVISGVVGFGVGRAAPDPASGEETSRSARVASAAVGAVHYASLLVFAGLVLFKNAIARGLWPGRERHRLLRLAGVVAVAAAVAAVAVGAWETSGSGDVSAWVSAFDGAALAVAVATFVGVALAYGAHTRLTGRLRAPVALTAAGVAVVSPVLAGHSRVFEPAWLMVAADVVHVAAAATWVGGLVGVGVLLRLARRGSGAGSVGAAAVVARFSVWAGATVAALGVSGVVMAVVMHRDWGSFAASDHGRVLAAKLAVVAVAVGVAAWNRFVLVPVVAGGGRGGLARLRRVMAGELVVVLAAVGVTGVLVHVSPAGGGAGESVVVERVELGSGAVEVVVEPASRGVNSVVFDLVDAQGDPLVPVSDPVVRASLPEEGFGPVDLGVEALDAGSYTARADLPLAGVWELVFHVRVGEFEHHMATVEVEIA
ncbi:copper resistance CopC/CopD family protein [Salininema proteolyticum]|uniref:Copper resistance protein CopC n=1 Tax=Salininema proteolyticum TaxID=1607685 RepID=A0ABV8U314_9ACTN